MKDYILTSVITTNGLLPLSGPGNAYYQKGDETYRLQANWIKGKKEGKAILYNSHNQVCAQLNYADDEINGDCVIRDDKGITRFHGNMVNGEKDGLCEEFDKNRVRTFYGYYEGGEEHPLLVPVSSSFPHLLKEFSRSGVLLTISEYDPLNCRKNGHCFIFENNNVVRCDMMNQGKRQFTYATYTADTMTCFDEGGNKVYEGSYKNDVTSLFCKEGMGCEFDASGRIIYQGLFHNNKRCWKTRHDSTDPSILLIYNIKDCDLLFRAHVNSEGRRDGDCNCYENGKLTHVTWWENGVEKFTRLVFSGNEATEYASDGVTVVYVGHVRNNWREGEGTEYRDGVPSYVGQWHNGVPNGEGSLLNEFGDVMCEGEWRWGYLYTTEGWLDYASREVIQAEKPCELPLWKQRGGKVNWNEEIEEAKRSMNQILGKKNNGNILNWILLILCIFMSMSLTYFFSLCFYSNEGAMMIAGIELVICLACCLCASCMRVDIVDPVFISKFLDIWEWTMIVVMAFRVFQIEMPLKTAIQYCSCLLAFFLVLCFVYIYFRENDLHPRIYEMFPTPVICSLFLFLITGYSLILFWGLILGLIPFFIVCIKKRSVVAIIPATYSAMIVSAELIASQERIPLAVVILSIIVVLLIVWYSIIYLQSDDVKNSMDNEIMEIQNRINQLIALSGNPEPVPFSRVRQPEEGVEILEKRRDVNL